MIVSGAKVIILRSVEVEGVIRCGIDGCDRCTWKDLSEHKTCIERKVLVV